MLKRRSVLLVKEEGTYGVDSSPEAASNAIIGIDVKTKETPEPEEREVETKSLSNNAALLGKIHLAISFQVELKGSGTRGTAPRVGDLLEACGFTETIVAGSSVNYAPGSASFKSVTIYHYIDGRLHKLTGVKGSIKIIAEAGKRLLAEFTMKGLYVAPTDTALATGVDYEDTAPIVCKAGTFSLNSVTSLVISQLELDMANVIALRPNLASTYGIAGFEITGRKPVITINPESVPIATYDFRTDLLTTPRVISLAEGATAGNIVTISAPKFNIEDIEYGDREGVLIETIKGGLAQSSDDGNDEVQISFT